MTDQERVPATEEEELEFEEYQRRIGKDKSYGSYQELIDAAQREEQKKKIAKLNSKIGERLMQLSCQNGAQDRLKLDEEFYQKVWEGINEGYLFDGDILKQYRLLELLVTDEYEGMEAREVRNFLEDEFKDIL